MRPGDLVRPRNLNGITEKLAKIYINKKLIPTFGSMSETRAWHHDQIALVVDAYEHKAGAIHITKVQVILDGHLWWVRAGVLEVIDEAR